MSEASDRCGKDFETICNRPKGHKGLCAVELTELLAPRPEDNPTIDGVPLQTFAARYATIALVNLPEDYETRKRIITNCIQKAVSRALATNEGR